MKEILLPLALYFAGLHRSPQLIIPMKLSWPQRCTPLSPMCQGPPTCRCDTKSWGNLPLAIEVYGRSPVTVPPNTEALPTSDLTQAGP